MRVRYWPPSYTPEFLSKDFCLQPGLEWKELLTKENLVRAKTAPTAISRTFTPLLRETRFLIKDSLLPSRVRCKIVRRWGRIGVLIKSCEERVCIAILVRPWRSTPRKTTDAGFRTTLIFHSLVFWFSLVFSIQEIPWRFKCFQLLFCVFLGFLLGPRGVKNPWRFGWVFLGLLLLT